jgi:hypothetical protein
MFTRVICVVSVLAVFGLGCGPDPEPGLDVNGQDVLSDSGSDSIVLDQIAVDEGGRDAETIQPDVEVVEEECGAVLNPNCSPFGCKLATGGPGANSSD